MWRLFVEKCTFSTCDSQRKILEFFKVAMYNQIGLEVVQSNMQPMAFLALLVVALVSGFVYNWLTPRLQAMLPTTLSSNLVLRSVTTGVFILLAVAVAHFVSRAVTGREGPA